MSYWGNNNNPASAPKYRTEVTNGQTGQDAYGSTILFVKGNEGYPVSAGWARKTIRSNGRVTWESLVAMQSPNPDTSVGVRLPPDGFTLTVPFTITYNGSTFTHNFDINTVKPAYTNTVYVGPGGTDTNTGLTYPLRVRSLKQAIVKANALGGVVRILADPGIYKYSDVVSTIQASWAGLTPSVSLVIESSTPGQKIISLCDTTMPSFVATATDPNVYVSTYTTQTPASAVLDNANLDTNGRPKQLTRCFPATTDEATVVAAINARAVQYGAGAHYLDTANKKLYVKLIANRAPDANLIVTSSGGTANFWINYTSGSLTVWAKDCEFWGCNGAFRCTSGATVGHIIALSDCFAGFTNGGHGYSFAGGPSVIYAQNCVSQDISQDGFNYSGGAGLTYASTFYEFNCSTVRTGMATPETADGSNNGSSCHLFSRGVRVNGSHTGGSNRVIHDIQDTQTWNLGVSIGPSRNTGQNLVFSAGFACGLSGFPGTAKMWLDKCTVTGTDYGVQAYAGGTLAYAKNCTFNNGKPLSPDGTLTSYKP